MLQKKYFLFLTSICILLVVWLVTMMYCQRRPDAAHPQKLVVSCGQRAFAKRSLLTTNLVGDLRSPDKFGQWAERLQQLTSEDAKHPEKFGLREGLETAGQNTPTTESNMSNILYFCFDDKTGNMYQSCKNNINDFAANLGQINKKDLDMTYNSIVNEGGCFDNTSGQMLQQCKDVINQVASNFTQTTKYDLDNGVSAVSDSVKA